MWSDADAAGLRRLELFGAWRLVGGVAAVAADLSLHGASFQLPASVYAARRRAVNAALGCCEECGFPASGRLCGACEDRSRLANRRYRARVTPERKAAGLCVRCGGPRDRDGALCSGCLEVRRAQGRRDRTRVRAAKRAAYAEVTARRKAAGLCVRCGKPQDRDGSECMSCVDRRRRRRCS